MLFRSLPVVIDKPLAPSAAAGEQLLQTARRTGKLLTVDDAGIALEVDREQVTVAFAEIGKARLAS